MRYYLCNILLLSYHSFVILSLSNYLDMKTFLLSLCHIYLVILHPNFISARSFFFPLSSLRSLYKASFCIRWMRLKYGVVLLTSYIPRIAVTLFLQFVFVITNNKINAAAVTKSSIHYYIIIQYFVTHHSIERARRVVLRTLIGTVGTRS
jgi:hypothetical protein